MTITLHDPALELARFKRQLKTFLFARYQAQRTERIRDVMIMRYTNILFTYLLTYLLTYWTCLGAVANILTYSRSPTNHYPILAVNYALSQTLVTKRRHA